MILQNSWYIKNNSTDTIHFQSTTFIEQELSTANTRKDTLHQKNFYCTVFTSGTESASKFFVGTTIPTPVVVLVGWLLNILYYYLAPNFYSDYKSFPMTMKTGGGRFPKILNLKSCIIYAEVNFSLHNKFQLKIATSKNDMGNPSKVTFCSPLTSYSFIKGITMLNFSFLRRCNLI